jgi:hypothetical protein
MNPFRAKACPDYSVRNAAWPTRCIGVDRSEEAESDMRIRCCLAETKLDLRLIY